ncbi:hypothetical protein EMCRGX_G020377 [Ephydatia muelleri]
MKHTAVRCTNMTTSSPSEECVAAILDQLDQYLGQSGCIKTAQEVHSIVSAMKESHMMAKKCTFLNILKATKSHSTLSMFMEEGGWSILNLWLMEAKAVTNSALMAEILQVLQKLPVTVSSLKQGNMGKLIKQLTKHESEEVCKLANELLEKWMAIFKEGQSIKGVKSTNEKVNGDPKPVHKLERIPKKDPKKGKPIPSPPMESQPPPGPLVALGKPIEKVLKRPRDILLQKGQLPPEKKAKEVRETKDKDSPTQTVDDRGNGNGKSKMLVESSGFMDALHQVTLTSKTKEKKPKKPGKPNAGVGSKSSLGDKKSDESGTTELDAPSSTSEMETEATAEGEAAKTVSNKKRVTWAEDHKLVQMHIFELDESERANTSMGHQGFLLAAQKEKMLEREAMEQNRLFSKDRLVEMIPWQTPHKLDTAISLVERGTESEEKKVQAEREAKVLASLYFSKANVPPSPAEPDLERDRIEVEPKLIPLHEAMVLIACSLDVYANGKSWPSLGGAIGEGQLPPLQPPPAVFGNPMPSQLPGAEPQQGIPGGTPPHLTNHPTPPYYDNIPLQNGSPSSYYQPGPPPHFPPYHGDRDYGYPPQQYASGPGPAPGPGMGPGMGPGPGPGPGGWDYYPDRMPFLRGGDRGMQRRPVGRFRGRGRGFIGRREASRICKHFLTHGCKLGEKCRFLHCTPEELASQMAQDQGYSPHDDQDEQSAMDTGDTDHH